MKKTRKSRPTHHRKAPERVNRLAVWVIVAGILLGLINSVDFLPESQAATGPTIKFIAPTHTEDLDMNSRYQVKFTNLVTIPGGKPLSLEFHVRDYENDQNYALIKKMTVPAGQKNGNFVWHVGYDLNEKLINWLPKNHLFLTAKIVGGNVSSSPEFHVVPADDGTGLPIVYLIDPNRGSDGYGPDGPYTIAIHGRNLTSKKTLPTVYTVLFSNGFVTKPGIVSWKGYTSRRLTVSPPKWGSEPMVVDVIVTTDKGSYTVEDGFEFFSRV